MFTVLDDSYSLNFYIKFVLKTDQCDNEVIWKAWLFQHNQQLH